MVTNYIQELIEDLSREGVEFIIAGGVAVVLQGVSRATMVIDASVSLKTENLQKLLNVMRRQNMVPRAPVSPEIILNPSQREMMVREKGALVFTFVDNNQPFKQLDIFLTEILNYEDLVHHTDVFQIGASRVRVLNKTKLIALKRGIVPPRAKDLLDIDELSKLLEKSNEK